MHLKGRKIADISPLATLSKLTHLELTAGQVTDLAPLSCLKRLEGLYLATPRANDLTPLNKMWELLSKVVDGRFRRRLLGV